MLCPVGYSSSATHLSGTEGCTNVSIIVLYEFIFLRTCNWNNSSERVEVLTPLESQFRFGGKLLEIGVVCPQNGTAVLKGLRQSAAVDRSYAF